MRAAIKASEHMSTPVRRSGVTVCALLAVLLCSACSAGGYASRKPQAPVADADLVAQQNVSQQPETTGANDRPEVSSDAMRRFNFSKSAMAQRSWKTAEEGLLTLVEDYPQYSGPALNLALVYRQEGEIRQAEHWFKQSFARNESNLDAYNQYAIFLRERGRFDEAEGVYQQALLKSDVDADIHLNLGILYDLYRGEKQLALQHYYRYQELSQGDDRIVAGWIADLERQLNSVARAE